MTGPANTHDDDLRAPQGAGNERHDNPGDDAVEHIELSEEAARFVEELKGELDDAINARQRALADFANYQRRAVENESRATKRGTVNVVRSILPALDHFDLALNQDPSTTSAEKLISGVKIVRDELAKALEQQGVITIRPRPGDEFDPQQHEAMMHQQAEGVAPGSVVSVLQPGYAMGEMVIRPAKVIVAPGADDESSASAE
jgi:molecular chaperone GrpE